MRNVRQRGPTAHCRDRLVGGKSLLDYDQVQARLAEADAAILAVLLAARLGAPPRRHAPA